MQWRQTCKRLSELFIAWFQKKFCLLCNLLSLCVSIGITLSWHLCQSFKGCAIFNLLWKVKRSKRRSSLIQEKGDENNKIENRRSRYWLSMHWVTTLNVTQLEKVISLSLSLSNQKTSPGNTLFSKTCFFIICLPRLSLSLSSQSYPFMRQQVSTPGVTLSHTILA